MEKISSQKWDQFDCDGYLPLGRVCSSRELRNLGDRINDIMLGKADVDYDKMMMQLDCSDGHGSAPGPQTFGFKGATLAYRKIQDLEYDEFFLRYIQTNLFQEICAKIYGTQTNIACFRAMFMNKPAREGTNLVWHQDRWTNLDRDPKITIWTALDDCNIENGCVHVIPGSHRVLVNSDSASGFLNEMQTEEVLDKNIPVPLELKAGEVVLLHNWLLHSSDVNTTDKPRRAFSVCYMDANTKSYNGQIFPVVFGQGSLKVENYEKVS